jgi:hypothetical protein
MMRASNQGASYNHSVIPAKAEIQGRERRDRGEIGFRPSPE